MNNLDWKYKSKFLVTWNNLRTYLIIACSTIIPTFNGNLSCPSTVNAASMSRKTLPLETRKGTLMPASSMQSFWRALAESWQLLGLRSHFSKGTYELRRSLRAWSKTGPLMSWFKVFQERWSLSTKVNRAAFLARLAFNSRGLRLPFRPKNKEKHENKTYKIPICLQIHILQNAQVTSNKMVHKKRHQFLATFSIPFHLVCPVFLRVLASKTIE